MANKKDNSTVTEEIQEVVPEVTMEETLESLQAQLKDFNEKAEYFKTMALKASGAVEVLAQLVEKKDKQ